MPSRNTIWIWSFAVITDFWSKLMSSARQLINTVHVDMLIVPLRDEEE